ncbi:MAG: DUF1800 domain-containing protein [uncultured Thiotrichaceae bacterium]|uniref:DUF1800 domain-containing protein n=1 Tax=uncultured Thiotrichaceae bacterium TaxID=298394 RepID=A0A6S6SMU9_9GAMM|nr:MAG: DUF1800 domain-containing protein [uncultured Thiotrichaceae bacterium]
MTRKLDLNASRHLVSRTGFGVEWTSVNQLVGNTPEQAINKLLRKVSYRTPGAGYFTPWNVQQNLMESSNSDHKKRMHTMMSRENHRLKEWWVGHMMNTPSPILEKMTLFWHSHFTSSLNKVEQPSLLHQQNLLLRKHALGNFGNMLKDIAKNPAMSIYLDGHLNEKHAPNENFARELLELFTVGRGHYSNHDIREVSRAFTGWGVNRYQQRHQFNHKDHDEKPKKVLGKTVQSGDEVLRVLLGSRHTANTIAKKFWSFFISDGAPDVRYTSVWATKFYQSNYDIKILLREVLTSKPFWDEKYRGTLTKSPADLVIGTLRTLPFKRMPKKEMVNIFRLLGQDLFDPPNVSGWKGGHYWIDSQTLLVRKELLSGWSGANLNTKVNRGDQYRNLSVEEYEKWLLPDKAVRELPALTGGKPRLIRSLTLDPMYQLT